MEKKKEKSDESDTSASIGPMLKKRCSEAVFLTLLKRQHISKLTCNHKARHLGYQYNTLPF